MIRFLLIALLALAAVSTAAIFIATLGWKRARKAEAESRALHEAFRQTKEKAERLQKALGEQTETEAKANAERNELAQTPDHGLVGRANSLFNGSKK